MSKPKSSKGSPTTLRHIAAAANTSIVTASKILRAKETDKLDFCSIRTAAHVREIARQLCYTPNRAARSMRTGETGMIGFVTFNLNSMGFPENVHVYPFLIGLNHAFTTTGRHVSLIEVDELSATTGRIPDILRERFFDALIVQFGPSQGALNLLEEFNVPVIYWDSGIFRPENCIYRDEFEVGRAVTRRLLELGHRRITFCVGRGEAETNPKHYSANHRVKGYVSVMQEHGLRPRMFEGNNVEEMADHFAHAEITGIITHLGCARQLQATNILGKRLPGDFSLLACDVGAEMNSPPFVGGALYNRYETGRTIAQMMIERLEKKGASIPSRVLPFEVSNSSTASALLTDGDSSDKPPSVLSVSLNNNLGTIS